MGLLCVRGGHLGFHWCWYHAAVDERSIWYGFFNLPFLRSFSSFPIAVLCMKFTVLL